MLTLAIIKRLLGFPVEHESWQLDRAFPDGQIDIDAITDSLLYLTDNQLDRVTAERLAIDLGVQVWSWGHRFDELMLKRTLRWNNIPELSDTQFKRVFEYLMLLNYAYSIGKYPSEMVRYGDQWLNPKYSGLIKPRHVSNRSHTKQIDPEPTSSATIHRPTSKSSRMLSVVGLFF